MMWSDEATGRTGDSDKMNAKRLPDRPAFVVGVSGTRKLDFTDTPKQVRTAAYESLKLVFRWLRGNDWPDEWPTDSSMKGEPSQFDAVYAALGESPKLKHTPLQLLSPIAPGADQLAAKVADEFDCTIIAPLPCDWETYLQSSTFQDSEKRILDEPHSFAANHLPEMVLEGRSFPVRLVEDVELSENEFSQRLRADMDSAKRRHLRYRAVGEFVAGHSHLLIALTCAPVCEGLVDDAFPVSLIEDDPKAGAEAIVQVKRLGLTPRLLARSAKVNWVDLGPVIHIHTPVNTELLIGQTPNLSITVLFPFDSKPSGKTCQLDREWQDAGWGKFRRAAVVLEKFNQAASVENEIEAREIGEMAGSSLEELQESCAHLSNENRWKHEWAVLNRLASVRRRSANLAKCYERQSAQVMQLLFTLTFAGAVLLHLAWHWHSTHESHSTVHKDKDVSVAKVLGTQYTDLFTRITTAGSVVCFFAAYAVFWLFKRSGRERLRHDARALAEGLRVQFYWGLAGIDRSVSANYMDRQRSELDWIRQAIRSLAVPYYRFRNWFHDLEPEKQLQRLQSIQTRWVDGQRDYFKRESKARNQRLQRHHHMGFGLAAAGVGQLALSLIVLGYPKSLMWTLEYPLECLIGGLTVILVLPVFGLLTMRRNLLKQNRNQNDQSARSEQNKTPKRLVYVINKIRTVGHEMWASCEWSCEQLFALPLPDWGREIGGYASIALSAPVATFFLCVGVSGTFAGAPAVWHLLIIVTATTLLGGAMFIAWAEKRLHAEHARQYTEMATLFQAASRRLRGHLSSAATALETKNEQLFEGHVKAMQDLLYDLGLQALDENAEWLILRRARPLEPVMAG